jgi:hypothetical protein
MLKFRFLPLFISAIALACSAHAQTNSQQDAQIRQVLTANAWCSFSYNKTSGASHTRRVVFQPDGMVVTTGGGETYSSGRNGTVSGQSSARQAARWKVYQHRVFADPLDGSGFQDLEVTATRNPNGYLILKSDGREYSMCN